MAKTSAQIESLVDRLRRGSRLGVGSFTCDTGVAFTDVIDPLIRVGVSEVFLFPKHANAASEVRTADVWVEISDSVGDAKFRVHHANSATADRTFAYVIFGR